MANDRTSRGLLRVYACFGPRPFREQHMRAHIVREHRAGRPLEEILADRYLERLGSLDMRWRVVVDPLTIAALRADTAAQIASFRPTADVRQTCAGTN